jgi:hypothetical protein
MPHVIAGAGDTIALGDNVATLRVTAVADVVPGEGIPLITEVRLPMRDLDQAWYEAATHFGTYPGHPPARDWNLESMGNTDLGEPLVAPFSGMVLTATNAGGSIGQVIQILGRTAGGALYVWAGWHLHSREVQPGQVVHVGDPVGSIGNAGGRYAGAHLHEQIARVGGYGIPGPTAWVTDARYVWQDPLVFYEAMGVDAALLRRVSEFDRE